MQLIRWGAEWCGERLLISVSSPLGDVILAPSGIVDPHEPVGRDVRLHCLAAAVNVLNREA